MRQIARFRSFRRSDRPPCGEEAGAAPPSLGSRDIYREIALFGAAADGALGVYSFTNDGKRSEGRLVDGEDVHPMAIAFQSQMPAGIARMVYWPTETGLGFHFAVESKTKKGWTRFLRHTYRPLMPA